jgi:MFS family permease
MTPEQVSRRWDLVGTLLFVLALCFCAEMLVYVVQIVAAQAMQEEFGSTGIVATAWRWLAWVPALVYTGAVLISLPLPRLGGRDTRWSKDGRMRIPPMGRGVLLFFGVLLFLSTAGHAVSFLPRDATEPAAGYVAYLMAGAILLLLLRMVLGALRLLPRSWRVAPEPGPDSGSGARGPGPGVVVPDQRFAPGPEDRA